MTIGRASQLSAVLFLAMALGFAGCSGGSSGGGGAPPPSGSGSITVAVTDAATDEIDTFEVDIVSFRFEKRNGATVEVLPQTARVDFAQLVSVSEVIAAATIPVGVYERAFMTLDFGSASARITGNPGAAILEDGQGNPLTGQREMEIVFPNGGFTVGAGKGYFAQVDFDLDQSLGVNAVTNTISVDAILFAEINPAQPKASRVPGIASNFSGSSFELDVRLGLGLISRGILTVNTNGNTTYDLQGQTFTGATGFAALENLGNGTLVVARGTVDPLRRTLDATCIVELPGNLDEVGGLVVARTGGPGQDAVLTLRGVAVRRSNRSVTFNSTVTLQTSFVETRVSKRGVAGGTLDTDSINVGQRILAYGVFSGSVLDLTAPGAGFVHLVETDLNGAVITPPSGGRLQLDVSRIGRRLIGAFDFDVEGITQADPSNMSIDTAGLSLAAITSGSAVQVRGYVAPVTSNAAAEPDFDADTVIDRTNAGSLMRIHWLFLGTSNAFAARAGNEVTVDLTGSSFAQVDRGLVAKTTLTDNPKVEGSAGLFAVLRGVTLTLFVNYGDYLDFIESELTGGRRIFAFRAFGRYDLQGNKMTAVRSVAVLL